MSSFLSVCLPTFDLSPIWSFYISTYMVANGFPGHISITYDLIYRNSLTIILNFAITWSCFFFLPRKAEIYMTLKNLNEKEILFSKISTFQELLSIANKNLWTAITNPAKIFIVFICIGQTTLELFMNIRVIYWKIINL